MSATVEIKTPAEWSTRLRLLFQEEEEAAEAVAKWAVELKRLSLASTVGSNRALNRYITAKTERQNFLAEIVFP